MLRLLVLLAAFVVPLQAGTDVVRGLWGARFDSLFTAAAAQGFHGSALIKVRGEVVLLKGYGTANEAAKTPFTPSTLVQIGSNVKDFTKTAVYQLVEQGRLRLADTLGRFIPGLSSVKSGITVAQLLEHTSGLPLTAVMRTVAVSREEMLNQLRTVELTGPPGTTRQYSNFGYSVLAWLVEHLSGEPFDAYVSRHILLPAGLHETGSYIPSFDRARIAHGYEGTEDNGIILDLPHDAEGHLWALRGNGGYLSTLSDMERFYAALGDTTLLREGEHRHTVFNPKGMSVLAGSDLICFFLFANYPGVGAEALIASNHSTYKANRLMPEIEALLGVKAPGPGRIMKPGRNGEGPGPASEGPSAGNAALPEDPVGRTIGAYLSAFNTGDTTVMRRFIEERMASGPDAPPLETRLSRYRNMRLDLGMLTFRSIRRSPEREGWAVRVSTSSGDPATLTFIIEDQSPYRIRGMMVMVGE